MCFSSFLSSQPAKMRPQLKRAGIRGWENEKCLPVAGLSPPSKAWAAHRKGRKEGKTKESQGEGEGNRIEGTREEKGAPRCPPAQGALCSWQPGRTQLFCDCLHLLRQKLEDIIGSHTLEKGMEPTTGISLCPTEGMRRDREVEGHGEEGGNEDGRRAEGRPQEGWSHPLLGHQ